MEKVSKSQHIIDLSKEIIDNIELAEYDVQALLLKSTRLARYVENEEIRAWLRFEMQGYVSENELSELYMTKTGRWTDRKENKGYWGPYAQIDATINSYEARLKQLRIPDSSSNYAATLVNNILSQIASVSSVISKLGGVKSRVTSILHDFATNVYYERVFDSLAESIFEDYKKSIDLLIAKNSGDLIEQIPSVIARLSDDNKESVSQALTTCRRIIESFANHIFPPTDETYNIGGNELSLKADKTLNRLNVYIHKNTLSESRRKKLKQNLQNLYERVSAGVHADVDEQEARSLFFNVYLVLGEILTLSSEPG